MLIHMQASRDEKKAPPAKPEPSLSAVPGLSDVPAPQARRSSLTDALGAMKAAASSEAPPSFATGPAPGATETGKPITWTDIDASPPCLRRAKPGREGEEVGVLSAGDDGFAKATWPDGTIEATEIPNLLVLPKTHPRALKRPASAMLKRPAAFKVLKKPAATAGDALPALPAPDLKLEHAVLFYKNNNRIGIREKSGMKKQIFSFGGVECKLNEQELRDIGVEACKKLAGGWSEHGTHDWCIAAIS